MPRPPCERESNRALAVVFLLALWVSFGQPALAKAGQWAIPTQSPQLGRLSAFAAKSTGGGFYECKVNGNNVNAVFSVTSHGTPGLGATGDPSVHYNSTNTDLYVFTRTVSGNLHLLMSTNVFNNSNPTWSWLNLGKPSAASIASNPASVSYADFQYAFVVGSDKRLHVVHGAPWTWSDHGAPAGVGLVGQPSTLVYDGKLYVFVIGDDGKLHTRYWNGSAWSWVTLGSPPSGTTLIGSTSAVTREQTIHVFAVGADHHLYIRFWNGSSWTWHDQGASQGWAIGPPAASWFSNKDGPDLYAFAIDSTPGIGIGVPSTNKLMGNHWDQNTGWELTWHGKTTLLFRQPAISGAFGGPGETWPTWSVNVFVRGENDRIYRRMYSPLDQIWQWSWSSSYCQL